MKKVFLFFAALILISCEKGDNQNFDLSSNPTNNLESDPFPGPGTWKKKADFCGGKRFSAVAFSIGDKGYMGTGSDGPKVYNDLWEYDPKTDAWTQKADLPASRRDLASGFSIGNKGYIGMGIGPQEGRSRMWHSDFWEYTPETNTWKRKADFGGGIWAYGAGFSIENKGYVGTGMGEVSNQYRKDFWEYDPITDKWTKKADFEGHGRVGSTGFSIGKKGYLGTGTFIDWKTSQDYTFYTYKDFWEYNPATDKWSRKADVGGVARCYPISFALAEKGYIGLGEGDFRLNDLWQYDPVNDQWTQKADFAEGGGSVASAFTIQNTAYVAGGFSDLGIRNDLWVYSPN